MNQDIIQIQGLIVFACVGLSELERSHRQKLLVDVQLKPQHPFESIREDISLTADYGQVAEKIRNFCATISCQLIETLASEIAVLLLAEFPVMRVTVRIRKFILPDTEFVAVQTVRERSH